MFILSRTALVEQFPERQIIYGRWDRIFGCWTIPGKGRHSEEIVPSWPLLDWRGNSIFGSESTTSSTEDCVYAEHLECHIEKFSEPCSGDVDCPNFTVDFRNPEAMHSITAYLECIPSPIRFLVAPFGNWQWTVLDAIWRNSELADFFASELRGFGPNFIMACVTLAGAHQLPKSSRGSLFQSIMLESRSKLLSRLSGAPWPRAALTALGKMDCCEVSQGNLRNMLECLESDSKRKAIAHARYLNGRIVYNLRYLPDWICLPNLVPLLDHPDANTEIHHSLESFLSEPPDELVTRVRRSLKTVATFDALMDRLMEWRHRIYFGRPFPVPPISGSRLLRPLMSILAIRREGHEMRNCLGETPMLKSVFDGRLYFYQWLGEERATVAMVDAGDGIWKLADHRGFRDSIVKPETTVAIQSAVVKCAKNAS